VIILKRILVFFEIRPKKHNAQRQKQSGLHPALALKSLDKRYAKKHYKNREIN